MITPLGAGVTKSDEKFEWLQNILLMYWDGYKCAIRKLTMAV